MLKIVIPAVAKRFNEKTGEFEYSKSQEVTLEHSLISISKWESKWHKPFLDEKTKKTDSEFIDYVRCMCLTPNVSDDIFENLSNGNRLSIQQYIDDPMTATWFSKDNQPAPSHKIITSEVIYSWMIQNNIPFECQKWHLNRLMVLIRVCAQENIPAKKMSPLSVLSQNKSLNAMRRAALGTKG